MKSDEPSQAGESAEQVAGRRRAKAQRLEKSAQMFERGAAGEAETALALRALDPEQWTVLHDVPWPARKYANIDHVLVGPTGVYVVDTKNWSGRLTISNGVLRQNGRSQERKVLAAVSAADAVAALVPQVDRRAVTAVLCFAGGNHPEGRLHDVLVVPTAELVPVLVQRSSVLDPAQVREVSMQLDVGLVRSWSPPSAATSATPPPNRSGARRHRVERRTLRPLVVRVASAAVVVAGLGAVAPHLLQR